VLHFSFNAKLRVRSEDAVRRGQYQRRSVKYRSFLQTLRYIDPNFHFEGSVRFVNSQQMVDLGFMRTLEDWERFIG
jgi:hypothetical protein